MKLPTRRLVRTLVFKRRLRKLKGRRPLRWIIPSQATSEALSEQLKKKPGRPKKPRRGGQPGHKRQLREPMPEHRVNETFDYEITDQEIRRLGLTLGR